MDFRSILQPAYDLLETPQGYAFIQWVGKPTANVYRSFLRDHVSPRLSKDVRVLDIGCGVGGFSDCFDGARYVGIDINPAYIDYASNLHGRTFQVMDATALKFPDDSYDLAATVAMTHHLSDEQLDGAVREALRVVRPGGALHLVDAILPRNKLNIAKQAWFRADRGRNQRTQSELLTCLGRNGRIEFTEVRSSILHDVLYARITRL